jgi:large subunit ribosomal protein L24
MKVKKGDKVIVIAGKDRGKTGTIVHALPKKDRIVIEGINMMKRHRRASRADGKGQIIEKPGSVHASNVMLIDPKSGKRTRVTAKKVDGKYVRIAKKSGTVI